MNVGGFILEKKDFENDSAIDYRKFLASRHSVREYSTKKLDEKDLKKAIETAILSPSACNRQMIKVYYISDPAKAKKVVNVAQGFGGFEKDTINTIIITFDMKIITTRQTGGLLVGYKPCYQPASQGAGFHFVQALLYLPLWHTPKGVILQRGLRTLLRLIYLGLYLLFLGLVCIS